MSTAPLPNQSPQAPPKGALRIIFFIVFMDLLGFGVNIGPAVFLLYLIALVAGVLILMSALKSSH